MSRSPIREALVTVSRTPSLVAGEIAWRWTFGMTVYLLLAFTFLAYLGSLTVSDADWYLLRSCVPPLMAEAMRHILRGSGPHLLRAAAVLLPTITVFWMMAASAGRWASLRALLEAPRGSFGSVLALHFLRAAAALAAWVGYLGALLLAGVAASRGYQDRPGLFLLLFLLLAVIIGFVHGRIRWFLSLAVILAMRDGSDAFSSVRAGFDAYRERRRAFFSVGLAISAMRLAAILLASVASLLPMVGLDAVRWKAAVVALGIVTLAYFLVSDFLHVLALAAAVEILRDELPPEAAPASPSAPPEPVLPTTHDLRPATGQPGANS